MMKKIEWILKTNVFDWDDDGAKPIDIALWDKAFAFMESYTDIDKPTIAPASDGSIHLNWRRDNRMFVIEIKQVLGYHWSSIDCIGDAKSGYETDDVVILEMIKRILEE